MQQRKEVLALAQSVEREAADDGCVDVHFLDDLAKQVEVPVELGRFGELRVYGQKMAELAVVDAHVAVDELRRPRLVRHGVLQVVEHHVGVVDIVLGIDREPVAVVPLAHDGQRLVDVLVECATGSIGL